MARMRTRILIVDDERIKRSILEDELQAAGYVAAAAANPLEAEALLAAESFDVILTDLRMPGQDGLSFLRDLKKERPDQAVIVMTAYGTVETAVTAMKLGAFDYLQKPFSTEELLLKLGRLLQHERLASENEELRRQLAPRSEETRIVGRSDAIRKVLARINAVSSTDTSVLIEGESGTGKELAARVIHETSHRAGGPLVAVACAALPKELVETELFGHESGAFTGATKRRLGRFELAHGGTLFLDDVDDVPLDTQVKLLRVLQNRTFERVGGEGSIRANVRVIAATKRILSEMVEEGTFREDLYYRLNVVPLEMPPLRERPDDIGVLIKHFLEKFAVRLNRGRLTIAPAAVSRLEAYHWPGNVRQLEHVLEQMVALKAGNEFGEEDVPRLPGAAGVETFVPGPADDVASVDMVGVLADAEVRMIRWALARSGGNLAQAAERLGVPRSTLQYKVSKMDGGAAPSP